MRHRTWIDSTGKVQYLDDLDPAYRVEDRPLAWQRAGRLETATGYGSALTSTRMVKLSDGRVRRVYVTQFSNAGTAWINLDGTRYVVRW
jgi:hypothetical protein